MSEPNPPLATPKAVEAAATMDPQLAALRVRIDALDAELLALLNRRAGLAQEVGELKAHHGQPIYRPEREAQVIAGLQQRNGGPLPAAAVASIWREVMSACRALEAPLRVAYLGPPGTFSEEAAIGVFGSAMIGQPCPSFDEVFRSVEGGGADFGVVPIENSTEGQVARSLDLLLASPLVIVGETALMVRHNLLRRRTGLDGIERVCAHPQALAQCHRWLSENLPGVERQTVSSNAEGARMAQADERCAAIASQRAASVWGLHTLAAGIQDEAWNRTRFAVLTDPQRQPQPTPSGRDLTSLVVSVPNVPGAVHELLVPLKEHGVSMARFESRPARSASQWEYHFFIDIEGHADDPAVAQALAALRRHCAFYKCLGSFPAAAPTQR